MPHVSDVRSTSHDRHDPMLVAALAADDLAGAERDQAIALTRTCADCCGNIKSSSFPGLGRKERVGSSA